MNADLSSRLAAAERGEPDVIRLIARSDGHITQCEHPCAKGGDKLCITSVGPMGAKPSWEWCGNPVLPTLKPSISCLSCGWHGFIRNGTMVEPTPAEWRAAQALLAAIEQETK